MSQVDSPPLFFLTLAEDVAWPCTVRLSARARRAKVSIDAQGGVELILPTGRTHSLAEAQKIAEAMLPWVQKTLDGLVPRPLQAQRAAQCLQKINGTLTVETLPASIYLPSVQHVWHVCLGTKRGNSVKLQERNERILLYADVADIRMCCLLLQKWLIKKSTLFLQEKTLELAEHLGLSVAKISIGAQKGRWGSCSAAGNIRLNCRLILLAPHLVEHVILHELCHRVHMNHSKAFKELLESVSPHSARKDKELLSAWRALPLWSILT